MKIAAFADGAGGVGATHLVYHLGWMYSELGVVTLLADLDPRAALTCRFLDDRRLEELWPEGGAPRKTAFGALRLYLDGAGGGAAPHVEDVGPGLGLLAGDPLLAGAEDALARQWRGCIEGRPGAAFRAVSALRRVLRAAAEASGASLVLVDTGPYPGALDRAVLLSADGIVFPLAADIRSLHALEALGAAMARWRREWRDARERHPAAGAGGPEGAMRALGYVVMRRAVRLDRFDYARERCMNRLPAAYRRAAGEGDAGAAPPAAAEDSDRCLGAPGPYGILMPLAEEARKPLFRLKAADGARAGHMRAVQDCWLEYRALARALAARGGIALP